MQSFADFAVDATQSLLRYADGVELKIMNNVGQEENEACSDRKFERLRTLAQQKKRSRMTFFDEADGRTLRLSKRSHEQFQSTPSRFFTVFGTQRASGTYKPHRSTFKCNFCNVYLCVTLHAGLRKNCWDLLAFNE